MSEHSADRTPWFKEPFMAAWAFIVVFLLAMLIGTSVLVGAASHEPRSAALLVLGPAVVLGGAAAVIRPVRRLFGQWWFIPWG